MEKEIEHQINEEQLQALFQGKKLVLDYQGQPKITLYPPRYGVFMTHEKYVELEQRVRMENSFELMEFIRSLKD